MNTKLFSFDNSFARELEGMSVPWKPATVPAPRWLRLNRALADELGLDAEALASDEGLAFLAGNRVPEGAQPVAIASGVSTRLSRYSIAPMRTQPGPMPVTMLPLLVAR